MLHIYIYMHNSHTTHRIGFCWLMRNVEWGSQHPHTHRPHTHTQCILDIFCACIKRTGIFVILSMHFLILLMPIRATTHRKFTVLNSAEKVGNPGTQHFPVSFEHQTLPFWGYPSFWLISFFQPKVIQVASNRPRPGAFRTCRCPSAIFHLLNILISLTVLATGAWSGGGM